MKTVTYDETQFAIVPIEPTEEMISAYVASEKMFNNSYGHICAAIAAAPPYPESNFVESLDSWIPASERLPEKYVDVLAWPYPTDYIMTAQIDNRGWWYGEYNSWGQEKTHTDRITHWMPMPAAPRIKLS